MRNIVKGSIAAIGLLSSGHGIGFAGSRPCQRRLPYRPVGLPEASTTCWMRQSGMSEADIVSMKTHGPSDYIGGRVNLYIQEVRAAEYHFCPRYWI